MNTSALDYFAALEGAFARACAVGEPRSVVYDVGGVRVRAEFASDALYAIMTPAMAHIVKSDHDRPPALTVCFWDTASTGVPTPPPPWGLDAYSANGEIIGYNDACMRTQYQPGVHILHMYDCIRQRAIYWIADAAHIPYWEASFPMRTILHWYLEHAAMQLVHAAAVGTPEGGVLITGKSGVGKSTTSLACLLYSDLGYVGDDYNLVSLDPVPTAHSLYGTAKLEADNLARFGALRPLISNRDALDTQKALLFVNQHFPEKMLLSFPIRAVIVPRFSHRVETTLKPGSAITSLTALAPTTLFHLPSARQASFDKMSRLVKQVPHYILETGTDLPQIPATIQHLLEGALQPI